MNIRGSEHCYQRKQVKKIERDCCKLRLLIRKALCKPELTFCRIPIRVYKNDGSGRPALRVCRLYSTSDSIHVYSIMC
jgi:hypothetical protein